MVPATAIGVAVALGSAAGKLFVVAVAVAAADGLQGQVSFGLGLRGTSDVLASALASASAQALAYWQKPENEDVEERGMRQAAAR